ncbi:NADH-quinone oxidoreductase subunit NuoH [Blastopirellula retiformator]|uniref:NADH-quinone oxidoreductase subunit H n=1 Tax=Blastopirellula retiformator TaxID=2527970 RepID=A0A5C5V6D9_9BACT|nr:NADH-quinone oxidoreductase subunit NuoH [Blastopirellula retiformator]TWT33305.1 NADH-quinone oxidoreductase subunit H [Blastopirellula retiformator]
MADYFSTWLPEGWDWVGWLVAAVIQAILLLHVIAVGAVVFIWLERKVAGRIQDRLGPTRTGGKFGWLQTLADGIKLLGKEDLMPTDADSLLFKLAPYISLTASFAAFMALPFASDWVGVRLNIGLFFILAVLGLEVFGVILAGYGSGSKWSLFGGMRQAAQVVSYEVPLGICVVVPVMIAGTMDLVTIGDQQAGLFSNWLFFHDPFCMILFWVYFTCGIASVNRAPFDLAEAESELVAGFLTEYSGIRWSLFFMAEYGSMFLVSGLAAILFFGGWNGPIPIFFWVPEGNFPLETLANLVGLGNFMLKASIGVLVMMWVRWTLPRLRIDQVITMCLKYCVPIAAFCFVGSLIWTAAHLPFLNDVLPMQARADVREGWVQDIDDRMQRLEKRLATEAYELNSAVEGGPQQEAQVSDDIDAADRVAAKSTRAQEEAR